MNKEKQVFVNGNFVGVAPKKPKNKAEANRYMNMQYEKFKAKRKEQAEELRFN